MLTDLLFVYFSASGEAGYICVSDSGNQICPHGENINGLNRYIVGNLIRLNAQFLDQNSDPIDPTTITLWVQDPMGDQTSYVYGSSTIQRDSTGLYHFNLSNDLPGYYIYRYEAAGNIIAAQNGEFASVPSTFGSL